MARRRLLWQIYPSYLVITLAALVGIGWFAAYSFEQFYLRNLRENLERTTQYLERLAGDAAPLDAERLQAQCVSLGEATHSRLAVIAAGGELVCDSRTPPLQMPRLSDCPEVRAALRGEPSHFVRFNPDRDERRMSVAMPVVRGGRTLAAIHATRSVAPIDAALASIKQQMLWAGVVIAGLAGLLGLAMARQLTRPLEEMRRGAERFARGELDYKLVEPEADELAALAYSLNAMSKQLQERIGIITRQNNEQRAILSSMVEGVLAVDNRERIISLNAACAQLLEIDLAQSHGRSLREVIRNADLQRFVVRSLAAREPLDDDLVLHAESQRVLQAHSAPLTDEQGRAVGAVVVLNDTTEVRRLDEIRRDFVANVSHELKTPITTIKGFIETLLDGAMHKPDEAERFLRIAARQSDRLDAIIEDLLSLSKIEQGERTGEIALETALVREVIEAALRDCAPKAEERQIALRSECPADLSAQVNAPLLQEALANLVDNAVKYSEPGSEVFISAAAGERELTLTVADRGCGIPAEHLPRIFERFYRVDKARSRKLGGTGLGLAIVKHIVQAHGGRVSVKSTAGAGSTFTIHLPRNHNEQRVTPT